MSENKENPKPIEPKGNNQGKNQNNKPQPKNVQVNKPKQPTKSRAGLAR